MFLKHACDKRCPDGLVSDYFVRHCCDVLRLRPNKEQVLTHPAHSNRYFLRRGNSSQQSPMRIE